MGTSLFTKPHHSNCGDGTLAHIRCYGKVINKSLHNNEHLQIRTLVESDLIEIAVFFCCCFGRLPKFATYGRFPWKVPTSIRRKR
jgi:hypothetical protein